MNKNEIIAEATKLIQKINNETKTIKMTHLSQCNLNGLAINAINSSLKKLFVLIPREISKDTDGLIPVEDCRKVSQDSMKKIICFVVRREKMILREFSNS